MIPFSVSGSSLEKLPEDIFEIINKDFTHKEIVKTLGGVSKKLSTISKKDHTWRNTQIHKQNGQTEELDLFLEKITINPDLPVENLSLSGLKLSASQSLTLSKWLPRARRLRSLSFYKCEFDFKSENSNQLFQDLVEKFKLLLVNSPVLEDLNFTDTSLSIRMVSNLIDGLQVNKGLKRLTLDKVYKEPFPATLPKSLYESLKTNKALLSLSFQNNLVISSFDDDPIGMMEKINTEFPSNNSSNATCCTYAVTVTQSVL